MKKVTKKRLPTGVVEKLARNSGGGGHKKKSGRGSYERKTKHKEDMRPLFYSSVHLRDSPKKVPLGAFCPRIDINKNHCLSDSSSCFNCVPHTRLGCGGYS